MRKIILVISLALLVLIISGCITTAEKEPVPDPIIGTWHRQSVSNGIPFFGDIQQISYTPDTITFKSDGTSTYGNWKWVSNNSYEIYPQYGIPNGTIKLDNDKMYLTIFSWWPPTSLNATYTK